MLKEGRILIDDVFRLLLMLADNESGVTLPEAVRVDIEQFTGMMNDEIVDVKALGGGLIDKESLLPLKYT